MAWVVNRRRRVPSMRRVRTGQHRLGINQSAMDGSRNHFILATGLPLLYSNRGTLLFCDPFWRTQAVKKLTVVIVTLDAKRSFLEKSAGGFSAMMQTELAERSTIYVLVFLAIIGLLAIVVGDDTSGQRKNVPEQTLERSAEKHIDNSELRIQYANR